MIEVSRPRHLGEKVVSCVGREALRAAMAWKFQPNFVMQDVHDLDAETLKKKCPRVKLVIFDVDNTLESHLSNTISPETQALFTWLREAEYSIAIASNCGKERGVELQALYGEYVDCIATPRDSERQGPIFQGKKPTKGMIVYILEQTKCEIDQAILFGDQLLKDTLAGNRSGIMTVYVGRYGSGGHALVESIQRPIEKALLMFIGKMATAHGSFELPEKFTEFRSWIKMLQKPQ